MILLLLALIAGPPADAFIFIRGGVFAKGERPVSEAPVWANRTVTFHVNTNQNAYAGSIAPEISSGDFYSAVSSAVNAWASACGSDIRVVIGGTTTTTRDSADAFNTIAWDNRTTAEGNDIASTGTLAVAYSSIFNVSDTMASCDIIVNGEATGNFAIDGNGAGYDLVGILVHEIGHCLGLDHSIEPPTFTSTNSILLTASMKSTVAAGDLSARTISQDEIDAMECVNPTSRSSRAGLYCGSYHGTNSGGALSGTVSGGPSSERGCSGTGSAVSTLNESGGGCITSAIAGTDNAKNEAGNFWGLALWPLFLVLSLQLLWRLGRRALYLGVFLFSIGAQAGFEISYNRAFTSPQRMNDSAAISSAEASFSSTQPSPQAKFDYFSDLSLFAFFRSGPNTSYGLYFRQGGEASVENKAISGGTTQLTKKTSLQGWVAGLGARVGSAEGEKANLRMFVDFFLGAGPQKFTQTMVDTSGTSRVEASALALETSAYLGLGVKLMENVAFNLKGGYALYRTNAYSVDSASGSRYATFKANQRMAVNGNQELKLDRSGPSLQAALELVF